jgi:hypothetical protein
MKCQVNEITERRHDRNMIWSKLRSLPLVKGVPERSEGEGFVMLTMLWLGNPPVSFHSTTPFIKGGLYFKFALCQRKMD